jgi:hypothetical protein
MRFRFGTAAVLTALLVAPLSAELKYTMHIEAKPSTAASTAPANPMLEMIGAIVASTMAPQGGLEVTVTVGDHGTRVDYAQAYMIVPAGGVTLVTPKGEMIVLDPAKRTFWKMSKPDLSALPGGGPTVTIKRTGQTETISGIRAERATLDIHMPLPVPPGSELPQGLPSDIAMTGDVWLSSQYKQYAKTAAGLVGGVNVLGVDTIANEGFMVKSILRGDLLGNRQIESTVTNVSETTVPASLFEIPAGFTEVPPPSGLPAMSMPMPSAAPAR